MRMRKGGNRLAALLACVMLLSAFLPSGAIQVKAAEVIATVYGTIQSGTTEELLLLSTAQGKMEIKLDSETDASECKVLLPGREIYVAVTHGSDGYLHAAKITSGVREESNTIDYSTSVTVTGEISEKTREDILYLKTDQGEMQIRLDASSDVSNGRVLMPGRRLTVSFYRGSDAYLHAARIVGEKESSSGVSVDTASSTAVVGTVDGKSTEDTLYLNTDGGTMELKLDSSTSFSNCRVLVRGKEVVVLCARGSDAYMHAVNVIGV